MAEGNNIAELFIVEAAVRTTDTRGDSIWIRRAALLGALVSICQG